MRKTLQKLLECVFDIGYQFFVLFPLPDQQIQSSTCTL